MLSTRQAKAAERRATAARIEAERQAVNDAVLRRRCPRCGEGLRENLAILGWWQCQQFGAEGFRKDASRPACPWQGFVR